MACNCPKAPGSSCICPENTPPAESLALTTASESNPGNELMRPASAGELRTSELPSIPPVTENGLLRRTPRIEVFGRESLPYIRPVSEPSILRSITERGMPSLFVELPGRILTERPGRTIVGEPTIARSVTEVSRPGRTIVVLPEESRAKSVFEDEENVAEPIFTLNGQESSAIFCCVSKPILNIKGNSFICGGDVRSYNKAALKLDNIGDPDLDPQRRKEPNYWKFKKPQSFGSESEGTKQILFEAYCSVIFNPNCDCTVTQEFLLLPDDDPKNPSEGWKELRDKILQTMEKKYDEETKEIDDAKKSGKAKKRLNGSWTPGAGIQPGTSYKDYINNWIQCCQERKVKISNLITKKNERATSAYLSYVDAPGKFGKNAKGKLKFKITFSSTESGIQNGFCEIKNCVIEFNLEVGMRRKGSLELVPQRAYCVDREGNTKNIENYIK